MSGKNSWNSPSDPYQNSGADSPVSLSTFVNTYKNTPFSELITEAGWRDGLPAGPKMRYVINPNDNRVMDMRHVLVVGFMGGNVIGFSVEVAQWYGGYYNPRIRGSAFNLQDFYSNNIGAGFSWHYYLNGGGNIGTSFWNYLNQK